MKRDYANIDCIQSDEKVIYFVGKEIEKTNRYGDLTLFVDGPRPYDEIITWHKRAEERVKKKIKHIYATANMSFKFWKHGDVETVKRLLKKFHVTIDGEANDILRLLPHLPVSKRLTVMVSVKIPYIEELKKYNCIVKLDDTDYKGSNPGVWCYNLKTLTGKRGFTAWSEYKQDLIIATEADIKRG